MDQSFESSVEVQRHLCGRQWICKYCVPTISCAIGLIFSVASTISCNFSHRNFASEIYGDANDLDLKLGLWTWRGLGLTNDSGYCFKYDKDEDDDIFILSARMFSVLSGIFGIIASMIATYIVIVKKTTGVRPKHWIIAAIWLLCTCIFEGFKFMMFRADICNDDGQVESTIISYYDCTPSTGASYCILSLSIWFITAILLFLNFLNHNNDEHSNAVEEPEWVEEKEEDTESYPQ